MMTRKPMKKPTSKSVTPKDLALTLMSKATSNIIGVTNTEREALREWIRQGRTKSHLIDAKTILVEFYQQGSFTVATVQVKGRKYPPFIGVAKRNCNDDKMDIQRGRLIALARAARGEAHLQLFTDLPMPTGALE